MVFILLFPAFHKDRIHECNTCGKVAMKRNVFTYHITPRRDLFAILTRSLLAAI